MNAFALATPKSLPLSSPLSPKAQAMAPELPPSPAALALTAAHCVEQVATQLTAACQRGQLEDASAAARVALPQAEPQSPHQALLLALAEAVPTLMTAPEENRLYLLRQQDGALLGLVRLRDNGLVGLSPPPGATHWALRAGQLELAGPDGQATVRFSLCGDNNGHRVYLGQAVQSGAPLLLQEVRCTYARLSMLDPELVEPFCGLYDIEAMVPAHLPERSAVLLAGPHSGGAGLVAALNRGGQVFMDGELLHPAHIGAGGGALPATSRHTLLQMRDKDPAWFARMMMSRCHDATGRDLSTVPVRGFTLAPTWDSPALDWAINEPALRIVVLVRSNLLAEFADVLAAQAVHAAQATSAPPSAGAPLHFEAERFSRFVDMKQRQQDSLQQRLLARDGDTVAVDASCLNASTVADLLSFLTDSPASVDEQAPPPLSTGRVMDRFDNPEDVRPALAAIGRLGWAEVEGAVMD